MPVDPISDLRREAEHVRASGMLGDARLLRLFEYLLANSLEDRAPKEIAIAIDVFDKDARFDVSQDAIVRVYIHKLRRTLADYYRAEDGGHPFRLCIPKGEYRLALSQASPAPRKTARLRRLGFSAVLGGVALCAILVLWLRGPKSDVEKARASPLWSWMLQDDRPILIVIGDYYLLGETDSSMEVKRLIREYSVNSKADLDRYLQEHPELSDRYLDVGLRYIPTATAFALRDVIPMLSTANRRFGVSMMSDVNAATIKSSNIVYIGYLSGMGIMKDMVFAGSRFTIGDSYDEILEKSTKRRYISQTASQSMGEPKASGAEAPYRDYGFFSSFRGPDGNGIIVISGTRDEGVRQTAEAFTNPSRLRDLADQGDAGPPFEALMEVTALDGVNLTGKVLLSSKRAAPPSGFN